MRRTIGLIGYTPFEVSKLNAMQKELPFNVQIKYVSVLTPNDVKGILFTDIEGTLSDEKILADIIKTVDAQQKRKQNG